MKYLSIHGTWFVLVVIIFCIFLLLTSKDKNYNTVPNNTELKDYSSEPSQQSINNIPEKRGNRLLGIGITEGTIGFDKAFAIAESVGVKAVELPIFWDEIETEKGKYVEGWLTIADQFFSNTGVKLSLSLNPIDTNNLRLPKDLRDKPFNDPEVIERYKSLVDFAARKVTHSDIFFVSIGNEIDVYLGSSAQKWQEYTEFFNAVAPYVREKFPEAVVGSKMTYDGILNLGDKARRLNKSADVVLATYYPFEKGGFIVRDPKVVHDDFKSMVNLYPDKKIFFAEIGYPSGYLNESSEKKQADFIRETFVAWDTYADKIPYLDFMWLHDQSPESVADLVKYYGLNNKSFGSFIGTLGLRTYEGKDKEAFVQFNTEIQKRGW